MPTFLTEDNNKRVNNKHMIESVQSKKLKQYIINDMTLSVTNHSWNTIHFCKYTNYVIKVSQVMQ